MAEHCQVSGLKKERNTQKEGARTAEELDSWKEYLGARFERKGRRVWWKQPKEKRR